MPKDVSPATLGSLKGGGEDMIHLRVPNTWPKTEPQLSLVIMRVDRRVDAWVGVWVGGWMGRRMERRMGRWVTGGWLHARKAS